MLIITRIEPNDHVCLGLVDDRSSIDPVTRFNDHITICTDITEIHMMVTIMFVIEAYFYFY